MRARLLIYGGLVAVAAAGFAILTLVKPPLEAPSAPPSTKAVRPEAPAEEIRLRPDARLLDAVAEVDRLVTGREPQPAEATFASGAWRITYRGDSVGTLPEYPDYPEMTRLLRAAAERFGARDTFVVSSAPDSVAPILRDLAALDALMAANEVDRQWRAAGKSRALLALGARALVMLHLETTDRVGVTDHVAARAWAAVATTQALDSTFLPRESCLLAHGLGYGAWAWDAAARLSDGDPVRLFVRQEDERLAALATAKRASAEQRFLHVVRVSHGHDGERWVGESEKLFPDPGPLTLPLLGTGFTVGKFELQMPMAFLVATEVANQLRVIGALADPDGATQKDSALGRLVQGFETTLGEMRPEADAVFLDRSLLRAYYRGSFYSALWTMAEHYRSSLSSIEATQGMAEDLAGLEGGPGGEFSLWYRHLAVAKAGSTRVQELQDDLAAIRYFGAPLLLASLQEVRERVGQNSPAMRRAARQVSERLDTRPEHRFRFAEIAARDLLMLPLSETLYQSSAAASSPTDPLARGWWARLNADRATLTALVSQPNLTAAQEAVLLKYLKRVAPEDSAAICAAYQRAMKRHPESFELMGDFVEYASKTLKAYRVSQAAIERWLAHNRHRDNLEVVVATSMLARTHGRQGDWNRALAVVTPVVRSQQYGAMANTAEALDKVGRGADAESLAVFAWRRYPDSPDAQSGVAGVLWRHGKYREAAEALTGSKYGMKPVEWRWTLGPEFVEAFRGRPAAAIAAAESMAATPAGDAMHLGQLALACDRAGETALAFEVMQRVRPHNDQTMQQLYWSWTFLKKLEGEDKATAWLRPRLADVSETGDVAFAFLAFQDHAWPLLWASERPRSPGAEAFVWLTRAAAVLQWDSAGAERTDGVRRHFAAARPGERYHALGRYLLGMESDSTVLGYARDARSRCEVYYYVGLKAQAEGRFAAAAEYYARCVATNQVKDGEYNWAMTQLAAWYRSARTLAKLAEAERRGRGTQMAAGEE